MVQPLSALKSTVLYWIFVLPVNVPKLISQTGSSQIHASVFIVPLQSLSYASQISVAPEYIAGLLSLQSPLQSLTPSPSRSKHHIDVIVTLHDHVLFVPPDITLYRFNVAVKTPDA